MSIKMINNLKTHFNICVLTVFLHICVITSCWCIFLCWLPPWRWPKKAETCSRFALCLYIIVSNYSAVVGVYAVTCHTAWNMDIFKFLFHFVNTQIIFATAYIEGCVLGQIHTNLLNY